MGLVYAGLYVLEAIGYVGIVVCLLLIVARLGGERS